MTMLSGHVFAFRPALFALACVPSLAFAGTPTPPEWTGLVSSPSRQATTVDVSFGVRDASLRFGEPANCRIVAALLYRDGEQSFYRFHPSQNGGVFCTGLYPGELTFTQAAPDAVTLSFQRGDASWSGVLAPAEQP